MSATHFSALRLAEALAVRLDAAVPSRVPTGEIALPDARVDAYCIYLWFGPGENRAAFTLPPVELPE